MIPDIQVRTLIAIVEYKERNGTSIRRIPLKWVLPQPVYESLEAQTRSGLKGLIVHIDQLDGSTETEDG